MKIYFVTGNKNKLAEAKEIMPEIEGCEIDLPEIQETNLEKIVELKLEEARKLMPGVGLIIEDQSMEIDGMNGLPGPLIKWFLKSLDIEGLYKLAMAMGNQDTIARTMVGYCDELGKISYFEGNIRGKIVKPRGNAGWGWDPIFQPDGYKETFGEMNQEQKNKISMRRIALEKLKEYIGK